MGNLPYAIPSFVRLSRRLGRDQVAAQSIDGWWRFEDPLPGVLAALAQGATDAFYDVGANTGFYSVLVGRIAPSQKVRAFEPIPEIARYLRQNLAVAGLEDRISVEETALSSSSGDAEIFLPPSGHGLVESSASLLSDFKESIASALVVRTETMDHFNDRHAGEPVGLIKIDVEGAEHLVVKGAPAVLARHRPIVAIELLHRAEFASIGSTFSELDYRFFSMRPGFDIREQDALSYDADSWNHLLVPAEKVDQVILRLDDAARQLKTFLARVGDPADSVRLEREAADLSPELLAQQLSVEARGSDAEAREFTLRLGELSAGGAAALERIAELEAVLALRRKRPPRGQAPLEFAQAQVSRARQAARRVNRRLRGASGAHGRCGGH